MRGALAWIVLSAAAAAGAEPCREEKLVVDRPRVIAVNTVDAAREVDFRLHTCEGSELDRLIRAKQVKTRLTFQDAPDDTIVILKGGRSIASYGTPPLVLVDAGVPGSHDVIVPPKVGETVARIARAHPEWQYAVIRGNERVCEIGPYHTKKLAPERLARMAEGFCRAEAPRSLVVVSATAPVWLAREATEWFTDSTRIGIDDEQQRREMGEREQSQILQSHNAGRALERLFESNRVVLVSGEATKSPLSSAVLAAARENGALIPLDRAGSDHSLCDVRRSYAGSVRFDMSAVHDHPSGHQPFELQLMDASGNVLLRELQELPDPTRRDWERQLIHWIAPFLGLVGSVTAMLFLMGFVVDRSAELFAEIRNALYGLSATTLGVALAILPNVKTPAHHRTFIFAILLCGAMLLAAVAFTFMAGTRGRKTL